MTIGIREWLLTALPHEHDGGGDLGSLMKLKEGVYEEKRSDCFFVCIWSLSPVPWGIIQKKLWYIGCCLWREACCSGIERRNDMGLEGPSTSLVLTLRVDYRATRRMD
jgi:hypothetical protein